MKVLLWGQPWHSQGSLTFHRNSLLKNLLAQGAVLAKAGFEVTFAASDVLIRSLYAVPSGIKMIELPSNGVYAAIGGFGDPSRELYEKKERAECSRELTAFLRERLPERVDVILVWEAPTPFLRELYPDAVIISEMPGAFCRPPYPQLTVFDPVGLFREGSLYLFADAIKTSEPGTIGTAFAGRFRDTVRERLNRAAIFDRKRLDPSSRYAKLWLLPLQITAHYAFTADTGFDSQIDFLLTALRDLPPGDGLVATQYVNNNVKDVVLTPETLDILRDEPIVFDEEFDRIPTISQFLLPVVDGVVTASSSLGFQALAWDMPIKVYGDTILTPYDSASDPQAAAANADKLLPFMLTRHQALADSLLEKDFLVPLIEDIHGRRKNSGLDRLPDYAAIDPGYEERVMRSFRFGEIPKRVLAKLSAGGKNCPEPAKDMHAPGIRVVSFDFFDTLVQRPFAKPSDLYLVLGKMVPERMGLTLSDFAAVRLDCEIMARDDAGGREISLEDIHRRVADFYGLSAKDAEKLYRLEIETELRFIRPKKTGKMLWDAAKTSGRNRIIVSDMYLPEETICEMAEKCGFGDYDRLFVSSAFGVTKKSGELFDVVTEEMRVPPASIIHFGDHAESDVVKPTEKGFVCRRLPANMELLHSHPGLGFMHTPQPFHFGGLFASVAAALTAERLFDGFRKFPEHDLFGGDAQNLGYVGLGPTLLGYVLWLRNRTREDGIRKLYFLAREGRVLMRIFEALDAVDPHDASATYLYCSRRVLGIAGLKTRAHVRFLAHRRYPRDARIGPLLAGRFNIDSEQIPIADYRRFGYHSRNALVGSGADDKKRFIGFCESLADRILEETVAQRNDYLAYLAQNGLFDWDDKCALVDIGWEGNMQASLAGILSRPLTGYYYATMGAAERLRHEGQRYASYCDDDVLLPHPSALVSNKTIAEYLLCDAESTVVKVERNADGVGFKPVTAKENDNGARRSLITAVHDGAMCFVGDMLEALGQEVMSLRVSPFYTERVMQRFFSTPTTADARLLDAAIIHDEFAGIGERKLVSRDVWPIGVAALSRRSVADRSDGAGKVRIRLINRIGLWVERRLIGARHANNPVRLQEYTSNRQGFFLTTGNSYAIKWWNLIGRRLNDNL